MTSIVKGASRGDEYPVLQRKPRKGIEMSEATTSGDCHVCYNGALRPGPASKCCCGAPVSPEEYAKMDCGTPADGSVNPWRKYGSYAAIRAAALEEAAAMLEAEAQRIEGGKSGPFYRAAGMIRAAGAKQ